MQKNKDLVIFTHDFPFGNSEKTFIQYEIESLSKDFENIEIINHKTYKNISSDFKIKKILLNNKFSKLINLKKIFFIFFKKVFFRSFFWKEILFILFNGNFIKKLKMCVNEACLAFLLYEFILKEKNKDKEIIFYSFWSNFTLISFIELKKEFKNSNFLSRGLGSDLNGYIKNDNYVPYKNIKFSGLDKLLLLGDYQKNVLEKINLKNKIEIVPLGVFPQHENINGNKVFNSNEVITFISCGNLIEIKNNFLMIDFLEKFTKQTKRKVKYTMIGKGILKKQLINQLNKNNEITFEYHEYVENLIDFLKKNQPHFFLNFSSQEGMAFSIMESMSCGVPTITSNIPPNEYLVKENGFTFDLNDYEKSIFKTIDEINETLKDKERYNLKSKKSFDFINKNLINTKCYQKFKIILEKL